MFKKVVVALYIMYTAYPSAYGMYEIHGGKDLRSYIDYLKSLNECETPHTESIDNFIDEARHIGFSSNGKGLVVSSTNETIKCDSTGCRGYNLPTRANVILNDDGSIIIVDNHNNAVCIVNPETGQERVFDGYDWPAFVIAANDARSKIAAGFCDGTIRVWDTKTQKCQEFRGGNSQVLPLSFSPDSSKLVSGACDGILNVWDLCSGNLIISKGSEYPQYHGYTWVRLVAFCGNDQIISICPGTITILDLSSGHETHSIEFVPTQSVVACNKKGTLVALGINGWGIDIYDIQSATKIKTISLAANIKALGFSPDEKILVAGCDDGGIVMWSIEDLMKEYYFVRQGLGKA